MKIDNVKFDSVTISSCPHGEVLFNTPGTYSWVVPVGVTIVSVVAVGGGGGGGGGTDGANAGGGGGGGALAYVNNLVVTPGETLTVVVGTSGAGGAPLNVGTSGGLSSIARSVTILLQANGGTRGNCFAINGNNNGGAGGTVVTGSGGTGGAGGAGNSNGGAGGGGAGGYSGAGGAGAGGFIGNNAGGSGSGGSGAGGSGSNNRGGGGGGVGLDGSTYSGVSSNVDGGFGGGGSGGSNGGSVSTTGNTNGGLYGGGGGGAADSNSSTGATGAQGAVRIIWGIGRLFPSTNVVQVTDYGFDIVRPVEFYVDATDPASYTSGSLTLNDVARTTPRAGTVVAGTGLTLGGMVFNGTTSRVDFGSILSLQASTAYSFGCWVRFNNVSTQQTIMGRTVTSGTGNWAIGMANDGYLRLDIGGQQFNPASPATLLFAIGTWKHVIVTMSASGLKTVYINGIQVALNGFSAPAVSTGGTFYVGFGAGTVTAGYLNGSLGEAYFYSSELTASEVLQNYNNKKWKYSL